jgi:hypothetical protein
MIRGIEVSNMKDSDINEAKEIWVSQYELYCDKSKFPLKWKQENGADYLGVWGNICYGYENRCKTYTYG